MHGSTIDLINLDRYNFLQLLNFLLHLYRLGSLIAETIDELPHVCHLFLLVLIGTQLLLTPFGTQLHILVVFHLVVNNLST